MDLIKYIPYEDALKLKERGFNEYCSCWYHPSGEKHWHKVGPTTLACQGNNDVLKTDGYCSAPSIPEVVEWIRKTKGLYMYSAVGYDLDSPPKYNVIIADLGDHGLSWDTDIEDNTYDTPDDALLAGIEWLMEKGIV